MKKTKIDWTSVADAALDIQAARSSSRDNPVGKVTNFFKTDLEFRNLTPEIVKWLVIKFNSNRRRHHNSYTKEARDELRAETRKLLNEYHVSTETGS